MTPEEEELARDCCGDQAVNSWLGIPEHQAVSFVELTPSTYNIALGIHAASNILEAHNFLSFGYYSPREPGIFFNDSCDE